MKKVNKINTEISELIKDGENISKPRELAKLKKRLSFLKTAKNYIETSPEESFIKSEIDRLQCRIDKISSQFELSEFYRNNKYSGDKARTAYLKMYDVPKLREQIKALIFLL